MHAVTDRFASFAFAVRSAREEWQGAIGPGIGDTTSGRRRPTSSRELLAYKSNSTRMLNQANAFRQAAKDYRDRDAQNAHNIGRLAQ